MKWRRTFPTLRFYKSESSDTVRVGNVIRESLSLMETMLLQSSQGPQVRGNITKRPSLLTVDLFVTGYDIRTKPDSSNHTGTLSLGVFLVNKYFCEPRLLRTSTTYHLDGSIRFGQGGTIIPSALL